MLGRILQSLDDLKKKVETSLDPDKGVIRELRDRTHKAMNNDQEHINRHELLKQECAANKRETDREIAALRQQINIDNRLSAIQGMIQGQRGRNLTPLHGHSKPHEEE